MTQDQAKRRKRHEKYISTNKDLKEKSNKKQETQEKVKREKAGQQNTV